MAVSIEIPTMAGTMAELAGRGFTEHFMLANGKLRAADSGKVFPAEEVTVSEYHRFEGSRILTTWRSSTRSRHAAAFAGPWRTRSVSTRTRGWANSCERSWGGLAERLRHNAYRLGILPRIGS